MFYVGVKRPMTPPGIFLNSLGLVSLTTVNQHVSSEESLGFYNPLLISSQISSVLAGRYQDEDFSEERKHFAALCWGQVVASLVRTAIPQFAASPREDMGQTSSLSFSPAKDSNMAWWVEGTQ